MKLGLTEKQYINLLSLVVETEISEQPEPPPSTPETGTSDAQSGGQGYPEVGKWESGATRGPANQIGITKWSDVVGSKLNRGKANPLNEQPDDVMDRRGNALLNATGIRSNQEYQYYNDLIGNINNYQGDLSDKLLSLREFMFSGWGLGVQLVGSVVGAEVGAPVAFEILDGAIFANDLFLMAEKGTLINAPEEMVGLKNKFIWNLKNNPHFLRVMEDILIIVTGGIIKGYSKVMKWVETAGESWFVTILKGIKKVINFIGKSINYIPGKIGKFLSSRFKTVNKVEEYFNKLGNSENRIANVVSKLPRATYITVISILGLELGVKTLAFLLDSDTENIRNPKGMSDDELKKTGSEAYKMVLKNERNKFIPNQKSILDNLYSFMVRNPSFKNVKREDVKLTNEKTKDGQKIFTIKGIKYWVNNREIEKL